METCHLGDFLLTQSGWPWNEGFKALLQKDNDDIDRLDGTPSI